MPKRSAPSNPTRRKKEFNNTSRVIAPSAKPPCPHTGAFDPPGHVDYIYCPDCNQWIKK